LYTVKAAVCADSLDAEETAEDNKEVKTEAVSSELPSVKLELPSQAESEDQESLAPVTTAPSCELTVTTNKFEFVDSIASFHATAVKKSCERQTLVASLGPHRRALCARRDLAVRRALCKVDKVPASLVCL